MKKAIFLLLAMIMFPAGTSRAMDYISFVGSEIDSSAVPRWRTPSVEKLFRTDVLPNETGNIYGTLGVVHWHNDGQYVAKLIPDRYQIADGVSTIKWGNSGNQVGSTDYHELDEFNPLNPHEPGIVYDYFYLDFTQSYDRVRLGIMWDVLGTQTPADGSRGNQGLSVRNDPNNVNSGTIYTVTENGMPDVYFFDLVNVTAGERFYVDTLFTNHDSGRRYIGHVMLDLVPSANKNSGKWNLNFKNAAEPNYLDISSSGKTNPGRALMDSTGEWTAATVRLTGTTDDYSAVSLAGLKPKSAYMLTYQNGQEAPFRTNLKGEATLAFSDTPLRLSANVLNATDIVMTELEMVRMFSMDFQGINGQVGFAGQNEFPVTMTGPDPTYYLGNYWNIGEVQAWWSDVERDLMPRYNVSSPLHIEMKDTDENVSTVVFETKRAAVGWSGDKTIAGDVTALNRDYMLVNNGNAAFNSVEWEISGLNPDTLYELIMFSGVERDRPADFLIKDPVYGDFTVSTPGFQSTSFFTYSDEYGKITGIFGYGYSGGEQNWGGFHLLEYAPLGDNTFPEPATWGMLLAGALAGGVFYGKKRRL